MPNKSTLKNLRLDLYGSRIELYVFTQVWLLLFAQYTTEFTKANLMKATGWLGLEAVSFEFRVSGSFLFVVCVFVV